MLDTIQSNIFPIISILIGMTGITLAIIFRRKSIRVKKPTYLIKTKNVFEKPAIDKLRIMYGRKKVENLCVTKVLFMNEGAIPIENHDIHSKYPIQIKFNNKVEIYDYLILSQTREANNFRLENINQSIQITFDYLNKYDAGIFQILHSPLQDKNIELKLFGEIKGIDEIELTNEGNYSGLIRFLISLAVLFLGFVMIYFIIDLLEKYNLFKHVPDNLFVQLFVLAAVVSIILSPFFILAKFWQIMEPKINNLTTSKKQDILSLFND